MPWAAFIENVLVFYLRNSSGTWKKPSSAAQLIAPAGRLQLRAGRRACPAFPLGTLDDGRLAPAGRLIADLVAGNVIAPDEPWIRGYLGLPASGD